MTDHIQTQFQSEEALPWLQALAERVNACIAGDGALALACWHDLRTSVAHIQITLPQKEVLGGATDGDQLMTRMYFKLDEIANLLAGPERYMSIACNGPQVAVMVVISGQAYGFTVEIEVLLGAGSKPWKPKVNVNPDGSFKT